MTAGAPRTVSLPPDEMIELGKEMIKWIKKNDPLHVSAWYSIEKEYTDGQWETMIRMKEFIGYYEQAQKIIGQKYLDKNSNVREGASQRWQHVYFKDLKKAEIEMLKLKAELARKQDQEDDDNGVRKIAQVVKAINGDNE